MLIFDMFAGKLAGMLVKEQKRESEKLHNELQLVFDICSKRTSSAVFLAHTRLR